MSIESLMLDTGMKLEPKIDHVPLFGVYVVDTDSHLYVMDDFGSLPERKHYVNSCIHHRM